MKLMDKIIAIIIGALGVLIGFVAGGTLVACLLFDIGVIDIPRAKEIYSYVQRYGYYKAVKHF